MGFSMSCLFWSQIHSVNSSLHLGKLIDLCKSEFPYLLNVSDIAIDITYFDMLL